MNLRSLHGENHAKECEGVNDEDFAWIIVYLAFLKVWKFLGHLKLYDFLKFIEFLELLLN